MSTVIPVLVPDIHLQSALVQTSLLQASVDQSALAYCDRKERTQPVTSSPRSWSHDSPTSISFYVLLLRSSQLTSTVIPVPLMDPTFVIGSGVCGWAEYYAFACLSITKERHNWRAGHVTHRPAISKNSSQGFSPPTVKSTQLYVRL